MCVGLLISLLSNSQLYLLDTNKQLCTELSPAGVFVYAAIIQRMATDDKGINRLKLLTESAEI